MAEIITLIVDIGLGALAYNIARTARADVAALRTELKSIKDFLTKELGWRG